MDSTEKTLAVRLNWRRSGVDAKQKMIAQRATSPQRDFEVERDPGSGWPQGCATSLPAAQMRSARGHDALGLFQAVRK